AASAGEAPDRRWLALPGLLPARVRGLARELTASAPSRYDQVAAVATYLRSHETYRLDSPVPAPGADAVDDFLFVSHTGFCEQFASAEVVLLRAAGVPARLVTGFAYGVPDADGRRLFRASDAHAWVEVWYPGVGWSASDPPAGARLASSPASLLDRLVAVLGAAPSARAVAAAVVVVAAVSAALVVLVGRRFARRRRSSPGGDLAWDAVEPAGRPLLRAFHD